MEVFREKAPDIKFLKEIINYPKKKHFYDAGQVYCFPSNYLNKKNFNFKDNILTYELPLVKSFDIDTIHDWKLAETIYRGLHSKK